MTIEHSGYGVPGESPYKVTPEPPELAKHTSAGKPQVQDIDPLFIFVMGEVLTQGLTKYPNDEDGMPNWWKGGDYRDFVGSIQRHAGRLASGEEFDKESGQPHAGHIAVDAMFLWSWMNRKVGRDTRLVTPQTLEALFNSALERETKTVREETSGADAYMGHAGAQWGRI